MGDGDRAGGRAAFFTTCNAVLGNHFQFVTGRQEPLWLAVLLSHGEDEQWVPGLTWYWASLIYRTLQPWLLHLSKGGVGWEDS